jgi:hypothetical protein
MLHDRLGAVLCYDATETSYIIAVRSERVCRNNIYKCDNKHPHRIKIQILE